MSHPSLESKPPADGAALREAAGAQRAFFSELSYTAQRLWQVPEFRSWLFSCALILLASSAYLVRLLEFSSNSDLYSHIPLIPLVSILLVWNDRETIRRTDAKPSRRLSVCLGAVGVACLFADWILHTGGTIELTFATMGIVALIAAVTAWWLDFGIVRQLVFPLAFLVFTIPFPEFAVAGVETLLQHGSAAAAHAMFSMAGTPVYHENLVFQLPGIALRVAPECSGIRSTLVLFITSVVAARMFLKSPWRRALLIAFVAPLALVRNGFRVFTLGELCVRVDPKMINSWIHHHGGPLFFALSLIPFFALLWFLVRQERRATIAATVRPA